MGGKVKKGDSVEWKTTQGKTSGEVVGKVTSETKVGGHVAKASEDEPQYVVKSKKTGKTAVHKPQSLAKR